MRASLTSMILGSILSLFTLAASAQHNTLSRKEKKDGWILLFDGQTTTGWRNFNSNGLGSAWKAANGELYLDTDVTEREERGDIITHEEFEDFELALEWKIDSCGNSGIMFNVIEDPRISATYFTGPEMQILDNECHPDAKIYKHRAGDLYDLIPCSEETVKPAGEWNAVRIVSKDANYEFWLNGKKVVEFRMHTPEWDAMVKESKFAQWADFGKARKGHIALQDHGDRVWFRNIKIKELGD